MNIKKVEEIFWKFKPNDEVLIVESNNIWLINSTFFITTKTNKYVFQKISNIFNEKNVCNNVKIFFNYLKTLEEKNILENTYKILTPVFLENWENYFLENWNFYRVYYFINNSKILNKIDKNNANNIWKWIWNFYFYLKDFNSELKKPLENFHNINFYYKKYINLIENNEKNLSNEKKISNWIESKKNIIINYSELLEELPKRVLHQDMKLSNILFDEKWKKIISVIDWDTIYYGSFLIDFWDMSRSFLKKMNYDLSIFSLFLDWLFWKIKNYLTSKEKENLFLAIEIINLELAIRYYIDYLSESKIFNLTKKELLDKIFELYETQKFLDENKEFIEKKLKEY